ncbi:restriction endonuclease subunit S [Finegoldia magna]|uniref:restriction endonuclease subunit S n=1 Tax=Finegoldia magna TaxID=1260 RepID=UPI00290FFAC4|nr:restriction endonuclease subunit S [Finegoldia magna]MDU6879721.1 restriction endonuclease subunit S [Finegoldia magna]
MSRLEELLQELCPNGVEYAKIGDICEVITGGEAPKNSIKGKKPIGEYIYPIYSNGIGENSIWGFTKSYRIDRWAVTFSSIGTIGYPTLREPFFTPIIRLKVIYPKDEKILNISFLKYVLEIVEFNKQKSSVPNVNANMIKNITIPVPPLEVQREIVRILDSFTLLTAELTAELTARKKQYQHYLNSFFENQTDNLVPLSSLGTITRGKRFVHADATETGVPCIHYGELYTFYGVHANTVKSHIREELRPKMRYAHKGDVIIVGAGENNIDIGVGVAWEGNEDVAVHDACYTLCHSQNSKYISFYLRSDMYHNQIKKYVSEGKVCSISATGLGKAMIPLPSITEQERIVSILDRFDSLCNDITTGLPAEIEARQKQYEFYRDKLLSFKQL